MIYKKHFTILAAYFKSASEIYRGFHSTNRISSRCFDKYSEPLPTVHSYTSTHPYSSNSNSSSTVRLSVLRQDHCQVQQRRSYCDKPPKFIGSFQSSWTSTPEFLIPETEKGLPVFRVLKDNGEIADGATDPELPKEELMHMYKSMMKTKVMDRILYDAQRQGRISFYMTNHGEEAVQVGSAAALNSRDLIWGQYREAGVMMYRGFPLIQFMHQCYGNSKDFGKGRQMPVHYGSVDLNFMTISSTLATQMPQAVGSAYAYKRMKNDLCVACFFGDGAASEGDAHAAFNFAAALDCPILLLCRNNGYAISTPANEQYRGDGIAIRGIGYGMPSVRVNGNDILAMYCAVKAAREMAISKSCPVLIEAMTYRLGHHSTSDDSSAYRSTDEVGEWQEQDPIRKLEKYMIRKNWWSEDEKKDYEKSVKKEVLLAFQTAEKERLPSPEIAFTDVYDEMPPRLKQQLEGTRRHVREYSEHYPVNRHEPF